MSKQKRPSPQTAASLIVTRREGIAISPHSSHMLAAPTALRTVIAALEVRDCRPKGSDGRGYRSLCPAHDNIHRLSLAITYRNEAVLLHCHAGCSTEAVLDALGLRFEDLFDRELERDHAA
jgi:hypothetical protein